MNNLFYNEYLKGRPVLILNPNMPNYPITYCSNGFQDITKFSRINCVGASLRQFIKSYDGDIFKEIQDCIKSNDDLVIRGITLKQLGGQDIQAQMCFSPIYCGEEAKYVIVFVSDISKEASFKEKFQDYVEYKNYEKNNSLS